MKINNEEYYQIGEASKIIGICRRKRLLLYYHGRCYYFIPARCRTDERKCIYHRAPSGIPAGSTGMGSAFLRIKCSVVDIPADGDYCKSMGRHTGNIKRQNNN